MPVIKQTDFKWKEGFFHNSEFCMLWQDNDGQTQTQAFIVKFEPGGFIPEHDHPGREFAYVIEGEMIVGNERLKAGDFLTAGWGEVHNVTTEKGVTFLIVIEKPIEIVEE